MLLTWTQPQTFTNASNTLQSFCEMLEDAFDDDPNWEVNASDPSAGWVELKPKNAQVMGDRILFYTGTIINMAMMQNNQASAALNICVMSVDDDGGTGPDVANLATATGPYSGAHTKYGIMNQSYSTTSTRLTVSSCEDGVKITTWNHATGQTWTGIAGRMFRLNADGGDFCFIATTGNIGSGNGTTWAQVLGAGADNNTPFTGSTAVTRASALAYTDGVTRGILLCRTLAVRNQTARDVNTDRAVFYEIHCALVSTFDMVGKVRQIRMGGPRVVDFTAWVDKQSGLIDKYGVPGYVGVLADTYWLCQYE